MDKRKILYLTDNIIRTDLPLIRKAIEDLPEDAITLEYQDKDKIVIVGYSTNRDITTIRLGREFTGGLCGTGRIKINSKPGLEIISFSTKLMALGGEDTSLEIRTQGHGYSFDGIFDLTDKNTSLLYQD